MVRLLLALAAYGNTICTRLIERTGRRTQVAPDGTDHYAPEATPDGGGVAPSAWYEAGLAQRAISHAQRRITALLARMEMEAKAARRAARAESPEAQERHEAGLAKRAEDRALKLAELAAAGLHKRYLMLKRPLGTEPPPRRSDVWRRKMNLIATIAGMCDADVVMDACLALVGAARVIRDDGLVALVKETGRRILRRMGDDTAAEAPGADGPARPDVAASGGTQGGTAAGPEAADNGAPLWPWPPFDTG